MEKVFFKLDGLRGESKAPRHVGEIEIYSFTWATQNSPKNGNGGVGREQASAHDLTIFKRLDSTTAVLKLAAGDSRIFTNGALTVEKISPSGGLLRSQVFKLASIVLTAVTTSGGMDTIGINFQGVYLETPESDKKNSVNDWGYDSRIGA